ncbi:MAG TPA: SAM-dependent methyltransferase [Thermoanaerobaculia bacterium]|nr:SAM-dependent methyltransferase [Thermoanaerobaculia bacterium]
MPSTSTQTFRNISDTAIWAALYRARETEREDALFRDPLAARLAGERGVAIASAMRSHDRYAWAWVLRTVLFDHYLSELLAQGADCVVNLAAGLDARPYRMALPANLHWVEVDLPGILDYKEELLGDERPVCRLERVRLDLADVGARRALFARLKGESHRAVILTEGLLIYLTPAEAAALAQDLAAPAPFRHWILDIASPGLLRLLQKEVGKDLNAAGAPLKFAPAEGPRFFEPHGWRVAAVRSPLKEAARYKRVPLWMRLVARFPEPTGPMRSRIWSGICRLDRNQG